MAGVEDDLLGSGRELRHSCSSNCARSRVRTFLSGGNGFPGERRRFVMRALSEPPRRSRSFCRDLNCASLPFDGSDALIDDEADRHLAQGFPVTEHAVGGTSSTSVSVGRPLTLW